MPLFETVRDLAASAASIVRRPYGVIEVVEESQVSVRLRPFPKVVSWPDMYFVGDWLHRRRSGNRCLLYYNQPRRHANFLALKYLLTYRGTSLATIRRALKVLEEIARLKGSDAILCDVANLRISDRFMRRYGWSAHAPALFHRNYIKRFYGSYAAAPANGASAGAP